MTGRALRLALLGTAGAGLLFAVAGGLFAPHDPAAPQGAPWRPPGQGSLLGTDGLGRDVLSRVLAGGAHLTLTSALAAALASGVGVTAGLLAGWRPRSARVLIAVADLFLAVPLLVVAMVLAIALPGPAAVVIGTVCGGAPLTLRIVADQVGQLRHAGFVEAALGRGEAHAVILLREVLPALAGQVGADLSARFVMAVQLAAALSLLGLGPAPPAPDWAAMIRENLTGVALNPAALVAPALALALVALFTAAVGHLASHPAGRAS